jgi:hypothetical protein
MTALAGQIHELEAALCALSLSRYDGSRKAARIVILILHT